MRTVMALLTAYEYEALRHLARSEASSRTVIAGNLVGRALHLEVGSNPGLLAHMQAWQNAQWEAAKAREEASSGVAQDEIRW